MYHGILDQGLQQQTWHRQRARRVVEFALHRQPRTQAQLLDAQILLDQVQFVAQCRHSLVAAKRGAKQIGQIFDGALGLAGPGSDQADDGVHAVEQEVRSDPCLQCIDLRLGRRFNATAPALDDDQVAQQRSANQGAQQRRREHERMASIAWAGQAEFEVQVNPANGLGCQRRRRDDRQPGQQRAEPWTHAIEYVAQRTQDHDDQQRQPLRVDAADGEAFENQRTLHARRQYHHQHHQLGDDHHREQGWQRAERWQPLRAWFWPGVDRLAPLSRQRRCHGAGLKSIDADGRSPSHRPGAPSGKNAT